jgi:hypothetical protein
MTLMERAISFDEVLDAVDKLSLDEQQTLLEIVAKRTTEAARKKLIVDILEARKEFSEGLCKPASYQQIMDEIIS